MAGKQADTPQDAQVANEMVELAHEWRELLNQLVPPTDASAEDITGAVHLLRVRMPAAVEMRIMRRLRELVAKSDNTNVDVRGLTGRDPDAVSKMIDGIVAIVTDEDSLKLVSDCFADAHPKAVAGAIENARGDEDCADMLPQGESAVVEAYHVFPTVDLVGGILPFGLRAVAKIGRIAGGILPSKR